ncbi:MAG: hypothetical protein Kow0077_18200 [Anaerolineae bacterium]
MTSGELTTVLLVEDDATYARLIRTTLRRASSRTFDLVHVNLLAEALSQVRQQDFDVIVLDLTLPDAQGLETFERMHQIAPEVPIVVLSGRSDEQFALSAMQAGAQDYLVKAQTDIRGLAHAISYAIERQRVQAERSRDMMRLAILRDVDEELNSRLDLEYVLMMALDTAVRLSLANAGIIGLLDKGQVSYVKAINYDLAQLSLDELVMQGIVGRCLQERAPQRVLDVEADPDCIPLLPGSRAQIAIPLLSQNRLLGFLTLETRDSARFMEDTYDFLKLLASRIASAVDNARLYEITRMQLTELQSLYDQVRDLEQMKTNVLRLATHDLRSPINNILGYVHLLRRVLAQDTDPQVREFLDYIEQSTRRMQSITSDILSLERLEANGDLAYEEVDLYELVARAYRENEAAARQKGLHFTLFYGADGPVPVRAEPALLYEAVMNLINNAIKYTPDGGKVEMQLHTNGTYAHFQVKDTGYGVPDEQQEHLFEPFFRARIREADDIDGTGLGLHLVKNIIARHKGEMVFESVYGEGSLFGFKMPLALPAD